MSGPAPCSAAPRLVLASGSPRRREMLERLGVTFTTRPVDVDEEPRDGESPEHYVRRLAEAKARWQAADGELLLAADTIVVARGQLLGKPRDDDDARRMLARLSGRHHEVLTGVAVYDPAGAECHTAVERTRVRFADLSAREIDWYVASGEPRDKAGAYAVQGLAALFIDTITGNYSNVVGLPLPATYRLLRAAGFSLIGD